MALHLYVVHLAQGRTHKKFAKFDANAYEFKPVPIGYGGNSSYSVVSHHIDVDTLHSNLVLGFAKKQVDDLRITEITTETLGEDGEHKSLRQMVQDRFLAYHPREYVNIPGLPALEEDEE